MPIEDFALIEIIGRGSFGKVHKARHRPTGTIVALKFIEKKNKKEKEIQSIRREIEILTHLQHENIICMFDAFETEHEFVVVMEYARGELFDILEDDKTLPEPTVRNIAKQLVRALHYLHMNRIIHRDLKPQNILLGKNGIVKLCDFGFARTMSQQTIVLTSIKGTPIYMSPELVQEQPYNQSVDLWSLGCILYELFYSKPPFFTQNIYQLLDMIKKDPISFPEPISPEFKSFLRGLLTKNAAQRLNWSSGLLSHPFVRDSPEDARDRALVVAQQRATRQKLEVLGLIKVGRQYVPDHHQQQQQSNHQQQTNQMQVLDIINGSNNTNQNTNTNNNQQQYLSASRGNSRRSSLSTGGPIQGVSNNATPRPGATLGTNTNINTTNNLLVVPPGGSHRQHATNVSSRSAYSSGMMMQQENSVSPAPSNNPSARVSLLRNSISMRMEQGFNQNVLNTISTSDRISPSSNPQDVQKLVEALQMAETSTTTAAVNPLHSSVFLARLTQEFFTKLVSLITRPEFEGETQVLRHTVTLLRLFLHTQGSSTISPFPSRAISDDAISLLRLRSECRVEFRVRQMACQAITDNPACVRKLLEFAAFPNIVDSEMKGNSLAILLHVTRGNQEGLAIVSSCPSFGPSIRAMFDQGLFTWPSAIVNQNDDQNQQKLLNQSQMGLSSQIVIPYTSSNWPWRPCAVYFLSLIAPFWDPQEIAQAVTRAVDDFLNSPFIHCPAAAAGNNTNTTSGVSDSVDQTGPIAVTDSYGNPLQLNAAAAGNDAKTNNNNSKKSKSSCSSVHPLDLETSFRSAVCSLIYAAIAPGDHQNALITLQKFDGSSNNNVSKISRSSSVPISPSSPHSVASPKNSNKNTSDNDGNGTNSNKGLVLGNDHIDCILTFVKTVLARTQPLVSCRPCGTMFGLPDVGILDDAVLCLTAIYRAAIVAVKKNNSNNSPSSFAQSQLAIAPEVTARLYQNSGFPFFEADRGTFSVLLALLYAGSCDNRQATQNSFSSSSTTLPGFDLSPTGLQSLVRGFVDALDFQLHYSGSFSVSCFLERAPIAFLPASLTTAITVTPHSGDAVRGSSVAFGGGIAYQHQAQFSEHNNNNTTMTANSSLSIQTSRNSLHSTAISMILSILSSEWLQSIEWWPSECGGGLIGARSVIHSVVELLQYTNIQQLSATAACSPNNDLSSSSAESFALKVEDAKRVNTALEQYLIKECIIDKLLEALDRLSITEKAKTVDFIMKLVMNSQHFLKNFVENGGLEGVRLQALLQPHSPSKGDTLSILCYLSRNNKDCYQAIDNASIFPSLLQILQRDPSEALRGRVCNLIGNLCKHNSSLYASLRQSGLIAEIVNRCWQHQEKDDGVRKFACFAVGNAAFHNDSLYSDLAPVIPALIQLLQGADDKARQNAAGALGNLVRNGTSLVKKLKEHRATECLMTTLESESASVGLKKNIVFSLGTLAQAGECKEEISIPRLQACFQKYAREIQSDSLFSKYVQRLKQKVPGL